MGSVVRGSTKSLDLLRESTGGGKFKGERNKNSVLQFRRLLSFIDNRLRKYRSFRLGYPFFVKLGKSVWLECLPINTLSVFALSKSDRRV